MIADTPNPITVAIGNWWKNRKKRELTFDERKAQALKGVTPSPKVNPFLGELPEPESNVIPFGDHPVVKALRKVEGPVNNRELAKLQRVSDGESSKRVQEVQHLLTIERDGKNKMISLRA